MGILFELKKKALMRKLQKAGRGAKKLSKVRKEEARQERELNKIKQEIKKASHVKLTKVEKATLYAKKKHISVKRQQDLAKAKKTAKYIGKTGLEFAVTLGKFLDKNVATGAPKLKKKVKHKRKRKKRRY